MEQPFSTSKVTVEYYDPHGVYKLVAPGILSRLPLHNLHWQSHSGPLRSIDTLHVQLVAAAGGEPNANAASSSKTNLTRTDSSLTATTSITTTDDGFQTTSVSGRRASSRGTTATTATTMEDEGRSSSPMTTRRERRHQIPGLRQTPYLKVLLVRCDDNDSYKSHVRGEIREWIKQNAMPTTSSRKSASTLQLAENHDAHEWMVIHVVLPNSPAYAQPRTSRPTDGSSSDLPKSTSRWGKSSSTLLEKLRADFNGSVENSSSSHSHSSHSHNSHGGSTYVDRVVQIRVGINDVPYELLTRVMPTSGAPASAETEREAQNAWGDLVDKFKTLILSSFDVRVTQYEEDIHEKDMQRNLPGWNFCTFFILKEGLARGFESVGLVEDALVGYDELSVGLDTVVREQQADPESAAAHGGTLLSYTDDLEKIALKALATAKTEMDGEGGDDEDDDDDESDDDDNDEPIDLQTRPRSNRTFRYVDDIPISSTKKPYRELILANNVSVFDFRCYIFTRQVSLLLRVANAWSSREELLSRLQEQQDAILREDDTSTMATRRTIQLDPKDEAENLVMLAEICRRTLEFIPTVSRIMREDLLHSIALDNKSQWPTTMTKPPPTVVEVVDNIVSSYAFSIAQQILAQTATQALPIPPPTAATPDGHEPKVSMSTPESKTMLHPARASASSSLAPRGVSPSPHAQPPPSPGIFPGPGAPKQPTTGHHFLKAGMEDLAARRADLYMLSRNILEEGGKRRDWGDGWTSAPILGEHGLEELEDVSLEDDEKEKKEGEEKETEEGKKPLLAGTENVFLRTALRDRDSFYRLYASLTDQALVHYTVARQTHATHANLADLAVLRYHLGDYAAAASYFHQTTPFFGASSWSLLELSMLILYARCLQTLHRPRDHAARLVQLLTRAAEAEQDRLRHQASFRLGSTAVGHVRFVDPVTIQGYLGTLLSVSNDLPDKMVLSLPAWCNAVDIVGGPRYQDHDRQDAFSLVLQLYSLLADPLPVDRATVHLVCRSSSSQHPAREIWLETREATELQPGRSKLQLYSNTIIPGIYEIDQIHIHSANISLVYDRSQDDEDTAPLLKEPHVILYQRSSALDVQLSTSKDLQLDQSNSLVLALSTGWNTIETCDIRIRAATGGLRLITTEAKVVGEPSIPFAKPTEGGVVHFGALPAQTTVRLSLPFSIEQDVLDLVVKIEVHYTTSQGGDFVFAASPSVSTALALGVNVQDVFKHHALFSRFTVSTASSSPLRLFRSELIDSDVYSAQFGHRPTSPPVVFPRQPASMLYRIERKSDGVPLEGAKQQKKTMYIRLAYSVLLDEIETQLAAALMGAFSEASASDAHLYEWGRAVVARVLHHLRSALTTPVLERVALLGALPTAPLLRDVDWTREFPGAGNDDEGRSVADQLALFLQQWQQQCPRVSIVPPLPSDDTIRTIRIPVDIPSITIVHTADIRLEKDLPAMEPVDADDDVVDGLPMYAVNQLLPATLHLRWTRMWDTAETTSGGGALADDLEFSFEVTAPTDAWLIGGRRKGHFVIPAVDSSDSETGLSSTPATEAAIPLTLIPLREGHLPYPSVDIREVVSSNEEEASLSHHCETDYRNLGETVRVVADRTRVTLSLDASGPGGGPLVLESDRSLVVGRVVV